MPVDSFLKELGRKVIHFSALVFLALYFSFTALFGHGAGLLALTAFLILELFLEYLRLERRVRIPLLSYIWDNFRREKELETLGAEIYFLLGVIVALAVFDIRIATAVILMTVFGDIAAALVGKRYGKVKPAIFGGKSIEGSLAALPVNLIIGLVFLRTAAGSSVWWLGGVKESGILGSLASFGEPLWPVIVVTSFAATATELASTKINDNLTVPIIAGFSGQITLHAMNFF